MTRPSADNPRWIEQHAGICDATAVEQVSRAAAFKSGVCRTLTLASHIKDTAACVAGEGKDVEASQGHEG